MMLDPRTHPVTGSQLLTEQSDAKCCGHAGTVRSSLLTDEKISQVGKHEHAACRVHDFWVLKLKIFKHFPRCCLGLMLHGGALR